MKKIEELKNEISNFEDIKKHFNIEDLVEKYIFINKNEIALFRNGNKVYFCKVKKIGGKNIVVEIWNTKRCIYRNYI